MSDSGHSGGDQRELHQKEPRDGVSLIEPLPVALFMFARDDAASLLISGVDILFSLSDHEVTPGWGIVIVREDVTLGEGYGKTHMDAARAALANARQLDPSEDEQDEENSN